MEKKTLLKSQIKYFLQKLTANQLAVFYINRKRNKKKEKNKKKKKKKKKQKKK